MNCLFCKLDSGSSKSVEHIIPESLGNKEHTLSPGVVCDKCNNYFGREVEGPFLSNLSILALRFEQTLPNKRNIIPTLTGFVLPGFPITAFRDVEDGGKICFEAPAGTLKEMLKMNKGSIILPASFSLPENLIVSRFLAKVALEALAKRVLDQPDKLHCLVSECQLDPIRNHARRGIFPNWPFYVRRIYDADMQWNDSSGERTQILHEFDILKTDWDEWFFILVIFGIEFTINYGGPEIEGYSRWLRVNGGVSPLYFGK